MNASWTQTFHAALVGAHVRAPDGFRPRDVKFLMELFNNWQNGLVTETRREDRVHNTQLMREFAKMTADNQMTVKRKSRAVYSLTRSGLIHGLTQVKEEGLTGSFKSYLFSRYFLRSYGERIADLIETVGTKMPLSARSEISALIHIKDLEKKKTEELKRQIKYFEERICETSETAAFVSAQQKEAVDLKTTIEQVEKRFPFELHRQKPLSELLAETPRDLQIWELTEGNRQRSQLLWTSYIALMKTELDLIKL